MDKTEKQFREECDAMGYHAEHTNALCDIYKGKFKPEDAESELSELEKAKAEFASTLAKAVNPPKPEGTADMPESRIHNYPTGYPNTNSRDPQARPAPERTEIPESEFDNLDEVAVLTDIVKALAPQVAQAVEKALAPRLDALARTQADIQKAQGAQGRFILAQGESLSKIEKAAKRSAKAEPAPRTPGSAELPVAAYTAVPDNGKAPPAKPVQTPLAKGTYDATTVVEALEKATSGIRATMAGMDPGDRIAAANKIAVIEGLMIDAYDPGANLEAIVKSAGITL